MSEKDWERFFELVDKIVSQDGTANEKAVKLNKKADEYGSMVNLQELALWIDDEA